MFTSKSSLFLFIVTSVYLFSNCSETTEPELTSNGLIPLKNGNSWNYILTSYDSSNVFLYDENQNSTVVKDTTFLNQSWFAYSDLPSGVWYTNKSDGYWSFVKANTGNVLNDTSVLIFRFPTQVGDVYGTADRPREVVATDENISVPAGNFRVIHIITTFPTSTIYLLHSFEEFIAPQIGIIKAMQIGKRSDGTNFVVYKKELVSYTLK